MISYFSRMRRIKTFIKSTMLQNSFVDLAILNIEENKINDNDI